MHFIAISWALDDDTTHAHTHTHTQIYIGMEQVKSLIYY